MKRKRGLPLNFLEKIEGKSAFDIFDNFLFRVVT